MRQSRRFDASHRETALASHITWEVAGKLMQTQFSHRDLKVVGSVVSHRVHTSGVCPFMALSVGAAMSAFAPLSGYVERA